MQILHLAFVVLLVPGLQATPPPVPTTSGTDASSGIQYAFVSLEGKPPGGGGHTPRLTAQCTRTPAGKFKFELLVDAGDGPELKYIPPFRPTNDQPFPPVMPAASVTMEFLGYTKVKPIHRRWDEIDGLPGEWRYTAPNAGSPNLEEIAFWLQYLKALPTLRLTWPAKRGEPARVMEFETTEWQKRVKAEPLCAASRL